MLTDTNLARIRIHIERLCDRHDWQLLDRDNFVAEIAAGCPVSDDEIVSAATNFYCIIWHHACSPNHPQRDRAYQELAHYLYDRAVHKYGDPYLAEEIVQETIILVAEQLDRCREPGAFMAFVIMKLWNAATTHFRSRDRHAVRRVDLTEATCSAIDLTFADHTNAPPELRVVQVDERERMMARLGELMLTAPRARNQFAAVLFKFLGALSDEEIASELDTDVANVHVLRSRGLKRLRGDVVLQQIANSAGVGRGIDL